MSWIERRIFGEQLSMTRDEILDSLKSGGAQMHAKLFEGKGDEDAMVKKVLKAISPVELKDKEAIVEKMHDAREWVGDHVNRVVEKIIAGI